MTQHADLDSLCSALLLAYLRSHAAPHCTLHIPLANMSRDDLALRTELDAVLRHTDIGRGDLLTLSDFPARLGADDTRWVLADHNALTGDLGRRFAAAVVGCVDHHEDEGAVPPTADRPSGGPAEQQQQQQQEPRVIRPCGSCASLVVEYCGGTWTELATESPDAATDAALARLAVGPILVDTTNLTSESKTTDTDRMAVVVAESRIRAADPAYDRRQFFDEITRLKEDLSALSYRDVLRKDYKQWHDGNLTWAFPPPSRASTTCWTRSAAKPSFCRL